MALLALFIFLLLTQKALSYQEFNTTTHVPALSSILSKCHTQRCSASPFDNPNLTNSDRMKLKIRRSNARHSNARHSNARIRYFNSLTEHSLIQAPGEEEHSEYILSYSIGASPILTFGVLDTGSDLIWLQCEPCQACLIQTPPLFSPSNSSTYKPIPYEDPRCRWLYDGGQFSEWDNQTCMYKSAYKDGALSKGHLSTETFWLEQMESEGKSTFDLKQDGTGGGLIDSGAVLTRLPIASIAFDVLVSHIEEKIAPDHEGIYEFKPLEVCYNAPLEYFEANSSKVTFRFNGSILKLSTENLWLEHDAGWCLALLRSEFVKLGLKNGDAGVFLCMTYSC